MKNCPVCNSKLLRTGENYTIDSLLGLWEKMDVKFSDSVIKNLKAQTEITALYDCPECRLGIFHPLLSGTPEFYQELQSKMDYYENDKWDFHEALKEVVGLQSVIEIGCGPGNFLMKCIEKGIKAYGTEYNQDAAKIAETRGIEILDNQILNNKDSFFDAVFCFHVLEHVEDPLGFIIFLLKLVKPGGKICISVPNQDGPLKYIDPCIMNMPPHHLTRWKLKTFQILAKKTGLKISRIAYEPLLLTNHSYYSTFWVNSFFKDNSVVIRKIKTILTRFLTKLFERLLIKNYKYFQYLRGQAIYIVFEKMK